MDIYESSSSSGFLTIVSNQNSNPFRMIVYNIGSGTSTNFDQASSDLTYTKFSSSGGYIFTSSTDNKLRMYKYNSNTMAYSYTTYYDTSLYGNPYAIFSNSDKYVIFGSGTNLIML